MVHEPQIPAVPAIPSDGIGPETHAAADQRAFVVDLDDAAAHDPSIVGGKAAALSRVRRTGLRTLDGVVLSTLVSDQVDQGVKIGDIAAITMAFEKASGRSRRLVVRSSSVVEDQTSSSAAGQFQSVVDVEGLDAFRSAVSAVIDSRRDAGAADHPIAVLVQPFVEPSLAGVFFGVDPVTGRSDRRVVTAVRGHPGQLVSGEVEGSYYLTDADATVLEADIRDGCEVSSAVLAELIEAGHVLDDLFGGPQDIEWATSGDELLILQSRPVTTEVRGVPVGPLFGPGPVAETFPEPLSRLEVDMWVPPLEEAVHQALLLSGVSRPDELLDRTLVVTVDGRVAIDLEATGEVHDSSMVKRLSPLRRLRRLRSAWRVGRLKAALPYLVDQLVDRADADLEALGSLDDLSSRQLVALIARSRDALRSLHAHEMLMGLLAEPGSASFTGASVALRVLAESRRDGLSDPQIIARTPVVLALTSPRVGPVTTLPDSTASPDLVDVPSLPDAQVRRETLRLRVRWFQELTAQAAWKLGDRLAVAGVISDPAVIRHLDLNDLEALVARRVGLVTANLEELREHEDAAEPPPLPSMFRLSDSGRPIAEQGPAGQSGGGTGAGGGVAEGIVSHDIELAPDGAVLVVGLLRPELGPRLATLGAIVAETGSVLSHLAILAREQSVPTVVGYAGALSDLPEGARVRVNGDKGSVEILDGASAPDNVEPIPRSKRKIPA